MSGQPPQIERLMALAEQALITAQVNLDAGDFRGKRLTKLRLKPTSSQTEALVVQ